MRSAKWPRNFSSYASLGINTCSWAGQPRRLFHSPPPTLTKGPTSSMQISITFKSGAQVDGSILGGTRNFLQVALRPAHDIVVFRKCGSRWTDSNGDPVEIRLRKDCSPGEEAFFEAFVQGPLQCRKPVGRARQSSQARVRRYPSVRVRRGRSAQPEAFLSRFSQRRLELMAGPIKARSTGFTRRISPAALQAPILVFWIALISCVIIGELLPGASPVMVAVGRLGINDKVQHFCAYLALSLLPVVGFRDRRRGIVAGLSMFVLGVLLEGGQHFSPGRDVELGDVIANGIGVACGTLLGLPIRARLIAR